MSYAPPNPNVRSNRIIAVAAFIIALMMVALVVQMGFFNQTPDQPLPGPGPDVIEPDGMLPGPGSLPPEIPEGPTWNPDGTDKPEAEPDTNSVWPPPTFEEPEEIIEPETNEVDFTVGMPPTANVKAVVDGPDSCATGELIRFTSEGSVGQSRSWRIIPSSGEKDSILGVNGELAFASRSPGEYIILLVVVQDNSHSLAIHTLQNGGVPEPGPRPPAPVPTPDGSWSELTAAVTRLVLETVPPSAQRVDVATKLSSSMDSVASAIVAGALRDSKEIREATRERNREAIGLLATLEWETAMRKLAIELELAEQQGRLVTPANYSAAWTAVANGLRAVSSRAVPIGDE